MESNSKKTRQNRAAEKVLAALVERLRAGVNPWVKPWDARGNATADGEYFAVNLATLKPYSGINQAILPAGYYVTFKQALNAGGNVKKGAKSLMAVWTADTEREAKDEKEKALLEAVIEEAMFPVKSPVKGGYAVDYAAAIGGKSYRARVYLDESEKETKRVLVWRTLREYPVFRAEDTEGLEKLIERAKENAKGARRPKGDGFQAIRRGERWISAYVEAEGISLSFGGDRAYYAPIRDAIQLPSRESFGGNSSEFYSTAAHEITHSTGHPSRLNRKGIAKMDRFGSKTYSFEELVAEIGAAMALGFLGIDTERTVANSAAYLASWANHLAGGAEINVPAAASLAKEAFRYVAERYEKALSKEKTNKKETKAVAPAIAAAPKAAGACLALKALPEGEEGLDGLVQVGVERWGLRPDGSFGIVFGEWRGTSGKTHKETDKKSRGGRERGRLSPSQAAAMGVNMIVQANNC